jgi:hypothetical protein
VHAEHTPGKFGKTSPFCTGGNERVRAFDYDELHLISALGCAVWGDGVFGLGLGVLQCNGRF